MDLSTLFSMSYGVYIISCMDESGARPTGCVANSVMQVTNEPNVLAVSVNHDNYTNPCMKKGGRFVVNILSEQSEATTIGTFGFKSGSQIDKFDGIEYAMIDKLPVLSTACGYVICRITQQMELSTHTLFVGEIEDCQKQYEAKPMTYEYYHKVIKGKSPKNAPTYIPDADIPKPVDGYLCTICGYVHEGEIYDLPDGWVCPICGVNKDNFVKQGASANLLEVPEKTGVYRCDICAYNYEGDIADMPDDYVCPICSMGKEHFFKL